MEEELPTDNHTLVFIREKDVLMCIVRIRKLEALS